MCPDRQILSVYLDQELPSPWKEKMETHLAGCPACREQLERYGRISAILGEEPVYRPAFSAEAARERVWDALSGCTADRPRYVPVKKPTPRLWNRSVSIPLPAIAAAAALFVAVFTLALINLPAGTEISPDLTITTGIDPDVHGIVPVADMNGLLQYLGQESSADIMIIRLPESNYFMGAGEPTIIKAADYSRSTGNR
jgi:hypothetical protein